MQKVTIIAEAGVNHNGDISLARQLVDKASAAGADFVKFQTFKAEKIASKYAVKADYQKKATLTDEGQLAMLKKLELNEDHHKELIEYCDRKAIKFLSTPFDLDSIELLKGLGVTIGKIPSGDITNLPYLEKMAKAFPELIVSTGMSTLQEIGVALQVLQNAGASKDKITVLHCNTEYPTPMQDVNLKAMEAIRREFQVRVGYSDHTVGIEVSIAAVALGAIVIEKHFTLNRNMDGPDHKASLEPDELSRMVSSIRNIEQAMGDGVKVPSASEKKNVAIARKSLVVKRDLPAGHVLTVDDLDCKRPGTGLSAMLFYDMVGKILVLPINEDEMLTKDHVML